MYSFLTAASRGQASWSMVCRTIWLERVPRMDAAMIAEAQTMAWL